MFLEDVFDEELGLAPKKKKAPKKKAVAKRAPPPRPAVKRTPAPKPKPKPRPKLIKRKAAKPKLAPISRATAASAARNKMAAPKARKETPPRRVAPPKSTPPRTVATAVARKIMAASGVAALARIPLRVVQTEEERLAPVLTSPGIDETYETPLPEEPDRDFDFDESPGDSGYDEPQESVDESVDIEEPDESADREPEEEEEMGSLETTEAVQILPQAISSQVARHIRSTVKPLMKHYKRPKLSAVDTARKATQAIAPACKCAGQDPRQVRARLNRRFTQRGYPPGTSDQLLAGVAEMNAHVKKAAKSKVDLLGHKNIKGKAKAKTAILGKLSRLAGKLPDNHPTKNRVFRVLLTARVL